MRHRDFVIRHLLEDREVDALLLIGRDKEWRPEPVLVAQREEADKAAGTKVHGGNRSFRLEGGRFSI